MTNRAACNNCRPKNAHSKSQLDNVVKFILNQQQHHKKETFRQEYLRFLKKFEIEFDEKYLFDFYD